MKFRLFGFVLLMLIIAGCGSTPKKARPEVFYPEPPDLPRIQYLTSFTGAKDIEPEKSAFDKFVVGKEARLRLDKPYGVAIYDGKIYVCDTNSTVFVFDLNKKTFGPMTGAQGQGKLIEPLNISVDADGIKYVTDPIRSQVVAYDRNDAYLTAYSYGTTPGQWKPIDAAAFEDKLYVSDMKNGVIRVFDKKSGKILKSFGNKGEPEQMLRTPQNLAIDNDGYIYVTDSLNFRIDKFDRDGHYIASYGKLGTNLGHFGRPKGIAVDRKGRLYAVDASFAVVQVFNKDRYLLTGFGASGVGPGNLILPAKVTIDYDNLKYFESYVSPAFEPEYLLLVTSQFGDSMVNVYAFGKEKGKKYLTDEEELELMKQKMLKIEKESAPEETGDKPDKSEKPEK